MKTVKVVIFILMIALALFLTRPNLSWAAEDGATVYKTKCAACHGAELGGKPAAKSPSLVSDDSKKLSAEQRLAAFTALHASGRAEIGVGAASVAERRRDRRAAQPRPGRAIP